MASTDMNEDLRSGKDGQMSQELLQHLLAAVPRFDNPETLETLEGLTETAMGGLRQTLGWLARLRTAAPPGGGRIAPGIGPGPGIGPAPGIGTGPRPGIGAARGGPRATPTLDNPLRRQVEVCREQVTAVWTLTKRLNRAGSSPTTMAVPAGARHDGQPRSIQQLKQGVLRQCRQAAQAARAVVDASLRSTPSPQRAPASRSELPRPGARPEAPMARRPVTVADIPAVEAAAGMLAAAITVSAISSALSTLPVLPPVDVMLHCSTAMLTLMEAMPVPDDGTVEPELLRPQELLREGQALRRGCDEIISLCDAALAKLPPR